MLDRGCALAEPRIRTRREYPGKDSVALRVSRIQLDRRSKALDGRGEIIGLPIGDCAGERVTLSQDVKHSLASGLQIDPRKTKNGGGGIVGKTQDSQQKMMGANVIVADLLRLMPSLLDD